MTTYLEILDTAVKIGLGALISGSATYFVTNAKYTHEIKKEEKFRRSELLEKIALSINGTTNEVTKAIHLANRVSSIGDDDKAALIREAQDVFLEVFKHSNSADSYAQLLGISDLNGALGDMIEESHGLYYQMMSDEFDLDTMGGAVDRLNEILDEMPNILAAAYSSIWESAS